MKLTRLITAAITVTSALAAYSQANSTNDFPEIERYINGAQIPASQGSFRYAPDNSGYLAISSDGKRIVKYDIRSGKEIETLMDLTKTRENTLNRIEGFTMSPEGSKILVYIDREMIYRRSYSAKYYVYELRSRLLKPLSEEHPRQQAPIFSPDGRMVAFAAGNNIYIKKLDYWSEVAVTTDGKRNKIINGIPDWKL